MSKERDILQRLVEWSNYMGGFDATVWRDAEDLLDTPVKDKSVDSNDKALLDIQELMDGVTWTPGTLCAIADILENSGYRVRDTTE